MRELITINVTVEDLSRELNYAGYGAFIADGQVYIKTPVIVPHEGDSYNIWSFVDGMLYEGMAPDRIVRPILGAILAKTRVSGNSLPTLGQSDEIDRLRAQMAEQAALIQEMEQRERDSNKIIEELIQTLKDWEADYASQKAGYESSIAQQGSKITEQAQEISRLKDRLAAMGSHEEALRLQVRTLRATMNSVDALAQAMRLMIEPYCED